VEAVELEAEGASDFALLVVPELEELLLPQDVKLREMAAASARDKIRLVFMVVALLHFHSNFYICIDWAEKGAKKPGCLQFPEQKHMARDPMYVTMGGQRICRTTRPSPWSGSPAFVHIENCCAAAVQNAVSFRLTSFIAL
jgi:hypothetical protein